MESNLLALVVTGWSIAVAAWAVVVAVGSSVQDRIKGEKK